MHELPATGIALIEPAPAEGPPAPLTRRPWRTAVLWGIASALLVLHAGLAWVLRAPAVTTSNDDAVYLLLARSLRSVSYTQLHYVGTPWESQYPPLYPAFLALLGAGFGEHLDLFLAASVCLSVVGLALFFDAARRRAAPLALLALAVAAVNPTLVTTAGGMRSEPLFMAWTGLALSILARSEAPRLGSLMAGGAAVAAALTRSAGVTVVAAVVLCWLVGRRWRAAAGLTLAAALTVGSWVGWTLVAPGQFVGRSYAADATFRPSEPRPSSTLQPADQPPARQGASAHPATGIPSPSASSGNREAPGVTGLFRTVARRVARNLPSYATRSLPQTLALPTIPGTTTDNWAWLLVVTTFGALGLWGMWRWWPAAVLTLLCYGALVAVWPYVVNRYLTPLLPLVVIVLMFGAAAAGRRVEGRWSRLRLPVTLPVVLSAAILVGSLPRTVALLETAAGCDRARPQQSAGCFDPEERAFFEATSFIAGSTPDTARFLAAKEGTFFYYTHRQVVPITEIVNGQVPDLLGYLGRSGAEYVLLSHLKLDEWELAQPLLAVCHDLQLVRAWDTTAVLLRVWSAAARPEPPRDEAACAAIRSYAAAPWGRRGPTAP